MLVITVLLVVFIFTFKSLASYIKKIRTGDPNESDITYWMLMILNHQIKIGYPKIKIF